jgi:hypothetical protein
MILFQEALNAFRDKWKKEVEQEDKDVNVGQQADGQEEGEEDIVEKVISSVLSPKARNCHCQKCLLLPVLGPHFVPRRRRP